MNKLLAFAALVLLSACSHDSWDPAKSLDGRPMMLAIDRRNVDMQWTQERPTRAGASDLEADMPATLSLWGYCEGESMPVFDNQRFFYIDGEACPDDLRAQWLSDHPDNYWPYEPTRTWTTSRNYRFFACAPYSDDVVVRASDGTSPATYTDFTSVEWNVPVYSACDYTYGQRMLMPQYPSDITDATLPVAMRHLMTRLRFGYRLGAKFGDLRVIRVKSMWVMNNDEHTTVTIAFDVSNNSRAIVSSSILSSSKDSVNLCNEMPQPYIELSAAYNDSTTVGTPVYDPTLPRFKKLASLYLLPIGDNTTLNIRVQYDIYDKAGQLLRQDDVAWSEITLRDADTKRVMPYKDFNAGWYRDVNITIEPEFLYALSDNDAPSDGTVIVP